MLHGPWRRDRKARLCAEADGARQVGDRDDDMVQAQEARSSNFVGPLHAQPIHWLTGTAVSCRGCEITSTKAGPSWASAALMAPCTSAGSSTRHPLTPNASATRAWSVRLKSTEK